jgi:prepilin-type N-terminal cleavage/methylation domain-containing protein
MKIKNNKRAMGFTLIEMVGVLAVIAILAALLVPKIFAAIDESRYNNTVASCNGVKAAVLGYFGKLGTWPDVSGGAVANFDQTLITQGFLENPFVPKIGDSPDVIVDTAANVPAPKFAKLDGNAVAADGSCVYIDLGVIPVADAMEISRRIDGVDMTAADNATIDDEGRVIYPAPAAAGSPVHVYIYLAHK